jgi:hypothetical protein
MVGQDYCKTEAPGTRTPYPTGRSLLIMAISSSISVIQRGVTTKTIRQVRRVSTEERCAEAALSSNLIRWTIVGPTSPSLVAFVEGIGGRVLPRNSAPSVALSADGSIVLMGAANDNGGVAFGPCVVNRLAAWERAFRNGCRRRRELQPTGRGRLSLIGLAPAPRRTKVP